MKKEMTKYSWLILLYIIIVRWFISSVLCWESWHSSCYLFVQNTLDYYSSQSACEQLEAHLVEVETTEEYTELLSHMDQNSDYWTGAQLNQAKNKYYWDAGGGIVLSSLWVNYAPDDMDQCARFRAGDNHRLNDKVCNRLFSYICEKREDKDSLYSCSSSRKLSLINPQNFTAYQSSYYTSFGIPQRAIDGNYNTNFQHCTSTDVGTKVWWQVDLNGHFVIEAVRITNRMDCCEEYLRNLEIQVHSVDPITYDVTSTLDICSTFVGPALINETTLTIECNRLVAGRYLRIVKTSESSSIDSVLTLCEVDVYGEECIKEQETHTCESPVIVYNFTTLENSAMSSTSETVTSKDTESTAYSTQNTPTTSLITTQLHSADNFSYSLGSTNYFEANMLTTTVASDDITNLKEEISTVNQTTYCLCPCSSIKNTSASEKELSEIIRQITNKFKILPNSTSAYHRALSSAGDKRLSAKGVGFLGISLLVSVFLLLVVPDVISFVTLLYNKYLSWRGSSVRGHQIA